MLEARQLCFIIMPFSNTEKHDEQYWNKHFEQFLKPLVEQTGAFKAHRSEPLRGDILKTIITNLIKAQLVVADITDFNPNVFWELGVRQSFKNGTITIAESGTTIPFDLDKKGVLPYYPNDHIKNAEFARRFQSAISDFLANPNAPDSQVLDTISGRGSFYEMIQKEEATRRIDALIEELRYNRDLAVRTRDRLEKKQGVGNVRFQICSLEMLVTHRYLNQPQTFYEKARGNLMITDFNNTTFGLVGKNAEQMIKHIASEEGTPWQKVFDKATIELFDEFKAELEKIKEKLEITY